MEVLNTSTDRVPHCDRSFAVGKIIGSQSIIVRPIRKRATVGGPLSIVQPYLGDRFTLRSVAPHDRVDLTKLQQNYALEGIGKP